MRIAVFTNQFPGWVSTFFARDMCALMKAGVDLDIFPIYPLNRDLWKYVPSALADGLRGRVHHLSISACLGSSLRGVPQGWRVFLPDAFRIGVASASYGISPLVKSLYVMPKAWVWSTRLRDQYDHILAYWGNFSATCAYVMNRLMGEAKPFSFFLHAGIDLYRNPAYLRQKLLHARHVLVVCDYNRRYLERHYPDIYPALSDKIHLHHLGLDLTEFGYRPDGRPPNKVLAVGRLEAGKGFHVLVEAVGRLKTRGVSVELELIGAGPDTERLNRLVAEWNIGDRVTFRGWLPPDEIPVAMRGATLLAHPSALKGDAVPTVIKEAMAVGTPVVATPVGGIPELLDDGRCGILVQPGNATDLADAIQRLLAREDLRRDYAQAARRRAEQLLDLWRNGRLLAERLASKN